MRDFVLYVSNQILHHYIFEFIHFLYIRKEYVYMYIEGVTQDLMIWNFMKFCQPVSLMDFRNAVCKSKKSMG